MEGRVRMVTETGYFWKCVFWQSHLLDVPYGNREYEINQMKPLHPHTLMVFIGMEGTPAMKCVTRCMCHTGCWTFSFAFILSRLPWGPKLKDRPGWAYITNAKGARASDRARGLHFGRYGHYRRLQSNHNLIYCKWTVFKLLHLSVHIYWFKYLQIF